MRFLTGTFALLLALFLAGFAIAESPDYVEGVLLVSFADDVVPTIGSDQIVRVGDPEIDRIFERFGAEKINGFFGDYIPKDEDYRYLTRNDYKVIFPKDTDMELVVKELEQLKGIVWAELDVKMPFSYIPNDPAFTSQWWLESIDAPQAWDIVTGDTAIIVTALDTGIDWNHPDLITNIWINPGEDLDDFHFPCDTLLGFWEQPGTMGDWNDVDDDGNGLVDDFIGWDFVQSTGGDVHPDEDAGVEDNNPMDFNGHGTGTNSAMAAVADNNIGGASVAYNCRIMSLRTGYGAADGGGYALPSAYIPAMSYAVDNGVKIVNMSFGNYSYSQSTSNACQNAWNNGVLLFGAAGNDGVSSILYPAGYSTVVAVAATDQSGDRAYFSNWGGWVNVAAPGVGCYTPWFNNAYDSWDGTSVASPIAAGVGALVINQFPNEDPQFWFDVVVNTTSQLDPDHPIGSGQVNAYNAVTQYYWPELSIDEWNMSDPDGNGHPDIGEEIEVTVSLSNEEGWQDAVLTTATISFNVEGVNVSVPSSMIGEIPAGGSGDNFASPMVFTVPDGNLNGQFAILNLTIQAEPNGYEIGTSARVMLGRPSLLFVDDDGGDDLESYIASDLDHFDYAYVQHDVSTLDQQLDADYLSLFDAVIWMTGDNDNPLTTAQIEGLQGAMDNGVNVFIFGQTLDEQIGETDFCRNYLHAESGAGNNSLGLVPGTETGDLEIPDLNVVLTGPGGAGNSTDPDVIVPLDGAYTVYTYLNEETVAGVAFENGTYKAVYFPFALEAASGASGTAPRYDIITNILSWFNIASVPGNGGTTEAPLPSEFAIESAYPNPFNPATTLQIALPVRADVKLRIFDLLGREVATLANQSLAAGTHSFTWNAGSHSAGVYFAVLEAGGAKYTTKLAYIK